MTTDGQIDSSTVCKSLRESHHSGCFACSAADRSGLALDFDVVRPGCVEGVFVCPNRLQSYDGVLHGGIICLLLDAAMTNCGFSMGRTMVTGDLQVRFLHPVPTEPSILVRAWADEPFRRVADCPWPRLVWTARSWPGLWGSSLTSREKTSFRIGAR